MIHIVLDLEATCNDSNEDFQMEIIEIGAVAINDRGEILDTYNTFVQPIVNTQLTDFCKNLTTIEQNDVDNAPKFPRAMIDFLGWIYSHLEDDNHDGVKLWSWGYYDRNQFIKDCLLHQITKLLVKRKTFQP